MGANFYVKDDQYILNRCTKYLSRFNTDRRHTYGSGAPELRDNIAESWRFPVIDSYGGGAPGVSDPASFIDYNDVTFIYAGADTLSPASVGVIGTFATLYSPVPLKQAVFEGEATRFWSVTYVVPQGQVHRYRFIVDNAFPVNDAINPQAETLDNGAVWSRFITDSFSSPVVMERWELDLLYRLAAEILPFETTDAANFLARFYDYQDRADKDATYPNAYRMDSSVGEVNFIDNILAREERHRLADYKICLRIIDRVLRQRYPYTEPAHMTRDMYFDLYNDMAANNVPGWDLGSYSNPRFFLYLLRRHVATGAFCHPKYGGNAGAAGWAYLSEQFTLPSPGPGLQGQTLFDWRRSLEVPLGVNKDYVG
ncbi:MAG: gluconate 2-dehydrogenase subunit 3 family protein [Acidobacteriota bacterium]|nr:gluconate 2-dehydrogenase subunit 3 family protein [Acidobacteriota bacterium]